MRRALQRVLILAVSISSLACFEHGVAPPSKAAARLLLRASVLSAGEQVIIAVGYERSVDPRLRPLVTDTFAVAGTGTNNFEVSFDLAPCLADAQRTTSVAGGCSVVASVALVGQGGVRLDSLQVGPFIAVEGAPVQAPAVTLRAPAQFVIESGNNQLGWTNAEILTPVVVLLTDRTGAPLANRAVTFTPSAGGAIVNGANATDANGRVRLRYRLGATTGNQSLRVEVKDNAGIFATVNFTAIVPQRPTISTAQATTCAVISGATRCWGNNDNALLSNPAVVGDTAVGVPFVGPAMAVLDANALGNGIYQACGLDQSGYAYCWGSNLSGELGVASNATCRGYLGNAHPCTDRATRVSASLQFTILSANGWDGAGVQDFTACGITATGALYCWGRGAFGELGLGAGVTNVQQPTLVDSTRKWLSVAVGASTTCGLTNTAEAWCWGFNNLGQNGDGSFTAHSTPTLVQGGQKFVAIDVGFFFTCGLTTSAEVQCWGRQYWYQSSMATTPLRVSGLPPMQSISAGGLHACGISQTGEAWCWGQNFGQLGNGDSASVIRGGVRVATSTRFTEVSAGAVHSCARSLGGDIYCWGQDTDGQLAIGGSPTESFFLAPVPANVTGARAGAAQSIIAASPQTMPTQAVATNARVLPQVRVVDALGFPVSGVSVRVAVTAGGGQLFDGATAVASFNAVTAVSGSPDLSPLRWKTGAAIGTNTLSFSVPSLGTGQVDFSLPTVAAGAPASFVTATSINESPIGAATFQIMAALSTTYSAKLVDAGGLPTRGIPVTLGPRSGSGIRLLGPSIAITDDEGVATFSIASDTVIRVNALTSVGDARVDTLSLLAPTTSVAPAAVVFRSVGSFPASVKFVQPPLQVRVGQPMGNSVTVEVRDRFGNLASQIFGTLTLVPANASMSATVVTPGFPSVTMQGQTLRFNLARVTFDNLTISAIGTYQLRASLGSTLSVLSSGFSVIP